MLLTINRPEIGLFFCAKIGEVFKKILVNDFDTPPTTHFQLKNRNGIFSKFCVDFTQICSEKCDLILDIVSLIILP